MVHEKGPGDIRGYPTGKAKSLKKMPDGNPYPYEQAEQADKGVTEPVKAEGFKKEKKYSPSPLSNEGDKGMGGHR